MDIAGQIKYATYGFLGVKAFHIVLQGVILGFIAEDYTGEGRLHFVRNSTLVFIVIICSGVWFWLSARNPGSHYARTELIILIIICGLNIYPIIVVKLNFNLSGGENHVSKSRNVETSTNPKDSIDEYTVESIYSHFITEANMWQNTIDLNTSLENSSEFINPLNRKYYSYRPLVPFDFESSTLPNKTTFEHATMNKPLIQNPKVTSKKYACDDMFTCVILPPLISLIYQVLVIAAAALYEKMVNGVLDNLLQAGQHQPEENEGEINLGFLNNADQQNNMEDGTPPNNENSQINLEVIPPPTYQSENPQSSLEASPSPTYQSENPQSSLEASSPPTYQ
ncbi:hypothetical protein Avbf_07302, partial [Armadillidium vulgare]